MTSKNKDKSKNIKKTNNNTKPEISKSKTSSLSNNENKSRFSEYFNLKNRRTKKRLLFFTILIAGFLWLFCWGIPLPTTLKSDKYPVSTKIFDRNDDLIVEIYAEKRRTPITLEEIPDHVKAATISIEDKDFYTHYGFSVPGMTRAAYNIAFKQKLQGGSTLTQQLVKNTLLSPERTIQRKVREFALAMVVEGIYTKDQILENVHEPDPLWINRVRSRSSK